MKSISPPMKLLLAGIFICTDLLVSLTLAQAKLVPGTSSSSLVAADKSAILVLPALPPGPPPGGRVRGGARRGTCPDVKPELTALVPFTEQPPSVTNVWGFTTVERPTLWFYIPYTKASVNRAELVLQDDNSHQIYNSAIALPNQPGVFSVPFSAKAPPLAVGKRYRWFFNVYGCDPQKPNSAIYVEGVIQRVNLNQAVAQQLKTAQPRQRVAIYAKNGIWHEALTTLAELRRQNPQDAALQAQWKDLLQAIGLSDVAAKPLVSSKP